jgi:hypothetical protein
MIHSKFARIGYMLAEELGEEVEWYFVRFSIFSGDTTQSTLMTNYCVLGEVHQVCVASTLLSSQPVLYGEQ